MNYRAVALLLLFVLAQAVTALAADPAELAGRLLQAVDAGPG